MQIDELIKEYIDDIKSIRRYSSNTVKAYQRDLNDFLEYCKRSNKLIPSGFTEKFIKSYLMSLNEQDLEKISVSRKLAALRGLFRFAFKNNYVETNPVAFIKNPKSNKKLPEVVSTETILSMYQKVDEAEENPELIKTILELLYGCALRVSEICNLKFTDLELDKSQLRILGKGNKTRIVPVGSKSIQILNDYLAKNQDLKNDYLIRLDDGRKVYPKYVYRIVNKYLSKVSDVKKKSPHILRHSAATHMLDNGADLRAVKDILGHENLSTTQIYTHVSIERLKKTYKKSHPKS